MRWGAGDLHRELRLPPRRWVGQTARRRGLPETATASRRWLPRTADAARPALRFGLVDTRVELQ